MLKGYDVSKWQTTTPTDCDFLIVRASCGAIADRKFLMHIENARTKGVELFGAYHYANTSNDPCHDAMTFYKAIENCDPYRHDRLMLILDIEGKDAKRKNAIEWCLKWCECIEEWTGQKPLIYCNSAYTKNCKKLAEKDYGLWVAHWTTAKKPLFYNWKFWALWQYSNGNGKLDHDYFNGTKEQFIKYCEKKV